MAIGYSRSDLPLCPRGLIGWGRGGQRVVMELTENQVQVSMARRQGSRAGGRPRRCPFSFRPKTRAAGSGTSRHQKARSGE